jgi:hypothetical protein
MEAACALPLQVAGNLIGSVMPAVPRIPVSPTAAVQDQRHRGTFDQKCRIAAVLAVAGISLPRRIVSGLGISGLGISWLLIPGLGILIPWRVGGRLGIPSRLRRVTAAQRQQQGRQHNITTHPRTSLL